MDVVFEDGKLLCKVNVNLISANVKLLVDKFKNNVEAREDYSLVKMDISGVNNIDSMGITFLIGAYKTVTAKGKKLELAGVSEDVRQLLKIVKLDGLLGITD